MKKVYLLHATYKDNDPETVGAYDSMEAMCLGFARSIAEDRLAEMRPDSYGQMAENAVSEALRGVARDVATLLPALLGHEWAADECRDGRTVYGLEEIDVEGSDEVFNNVTNECEEDEQDEEEEDD